MLEQPPLVRSPLLAIGAALGGVGGVARGEGAGRGALQVNGGPVSGDKPRLV